MAGKAKLPVGIENFKEMRTGDYIMRDAAGWCPVKRGI